MNAYVIKRLVLDELNDSESELSSCSDTTDSSDTESLLKVVFSSLDRKNSFFDEILSTYTDKEFITHFRISRTLYTELVTMFSESKEYIKLESRKAYSPEMQIALFLWFAGHEKCTYRDVSDQFKLSLGTACMVMYRVLNFLSNLSEKVIRWPTEEEQTKTDHFMKSKTGIQGFIGIIDCARIRIDHPKVRKNVYIDRRKKISSLCLQGICNENMKFIHISVGFPGPVQNNRVFKNSSIHRKLPNLCRNGFLLGDTTYASSRYLITPYRDNGKLSPKQKFFNRKLNSARTPIDHAFGLLKHRFQQLKHCKMKGIGKICRFIQACVVLHNLSKHDELPFDENEKMEENNHISSDQEQDFSYRDILCEEVFSHFGSNKKRKV